MIRYFIFGVTDELLKIVSENCRYVKDFRKRQSNVLTLYQTEGKFKLDKKRELKK